MTLFDRYREVTARVAAAAGRAGRSPGDTVVVAVAKTFSVDRVVEAVDAGVHDIGENRAQELAHKAAVVGRPVRWHFVGYLQSNKVRQVVGVAELVHSVERIGLAEAIGRRAVSLGLRQRVLIEVNIAGESSKHGIEPPGVVTLARALRDLDGIEVAGLMTIPPATGDPELSRPFFRDLARLGADLRAEVPGAHHLSMGMSGDFEIAVEEGATLVRVGEAIFGPRVPR